MIFRGLRLTYDETRLRIHCERGKALGSMVGLEALRVDMKDGSKFNPDQVQVITWKNGKAIKNKFYYNPNF